MGFNVGNKSKVGFRAEIKRKQAMFNRFQRRCCTTTCTPTERKFLKAECGRIVKELKTCAKQWKACGFGGNLWITKNFNLVGFTPKTSSRKAKSSNYGRKSVRSSARKSRSYGRKSRTSARRTTNRSKARVRSTTRKSSARRSYVAW